jgi:hypothetical protein
VGSPSKKLIKDASNNEMTLIPPGALAAAELLHNVKRNQIVADLTIDDRTLVIVNSRIGEKPSHAYVT